MIIDSDSDGDMVKEEEDDYVPNIYMDEEEINKDLEEMENLKKENK